MMATAASESLLAIEEFFADLRLFANTPFNGVVHGQTLISMRREVRRGSQR